MHSHISVVLWGTIEKIGSISDLFRCDLLWRCQNELAVSFANDRTYSKNLKIIYSVFKIPCHGTFFGFFFFGWQQCLVKCGSLHKFCLCHNCIILLCCSHFSSILANLSAPLYWVSHISPCHNPTTSIWSQSTISSHRNRDLWQIFCCLPSLSLCCRAQ